MKKILYLSIFILSVLMISCKPDSVDNGDNANNTDNPSQEEPLVKKYLVREYYDDRDKPILIIDWNDDFTRIEHLITDSGGMYQVNYHFQYYDEDSIKIYITLPEVNQGFYAYTNYICHLNDGRISKIDTYFNEKYKDTRDYKYDNDGRLIEAGLVRFIWEDNNVIKRYSSYDSDTLYYAKRGEHIHPYYTLPYLLPTCSYFSSFATFITQPLWKNMDECSDRGCYEYDTDGYVTYTYHITEEGEHQTFRRYEYDY